MPSSPQSPPSAVPFDLLSLLTPQGLLQAAPCGIFLVDRGQRIVHWNAEAERITGYPAAEAIGRHCSFLSGIPCGEGCGLYDEGIEKPLIGAPCSILTRDGRRISLLKNVDYLRAPDGGVVGGLEAFIEVTRMVQLEDRLRRQTSDLRAKVRTRTLQLVDERNRLRNLLDAMPDLAYITGADRRIRYMNLALIEAVGDGVGASCHQVLHGLAAPCPWCPLPEVLDGRLVREERRFPLTGRTYEILHTPLPEEGKTIGKLAIFRDITERQEAEAKLREAYQELDAFVYTLSHDLRTPLTPIIGYADFLQEHYGRSLEPQAIEMLQEIEQQGRRAIDMMENLLELSRVGRVAAPAEPVDVDMIVALAVDELGQRIEECGVQVEVSPLPGLLVPATLLSQVFTNLIGNAVRYAGGPGARIEIGSLPAAGERIFVRDHGPGIPAAERERIFDLFYRGSTAGGTSGTGLGLAIVRKVVRLYGGQIWVEETPGGGSTFLLDFPPPAGDAAG